MHAVRRFLGAAVPVFLIAALAPSWTEAHTPGAAGAGLLAGLAHPFWGWDHLLAMAAVGIWAVQLGGRALWALPGAFVGAMLLGALAGVTGVVLPGMEAMIASSVVVLGALIALGRRQPLWAGAAVVALFGLFHGHAHGLEAPQAAAPALYVAGFVAATAALHVSGILAARLLRGGGARLRAVGAGIAAAGLVLIFL